MSIIFCKKRPASYQAAVTKFRLDKNPPSNTKKHKVNSISIVVKLFYSPIPGILNRRTERCNIVFRQTVNNIDRTDVDDILRTCYIKMFAAFTRYVGGPVRRELLCLLSRDTATSATGSLPQGK
jgi:hypothetical protein